MISEIITFCIPDGMTRDERQANFRRTALSWGANPYFRFENSVRFSGKCDSNQAAPSSRPID
jgi:hypothetical protein